MARAHQHPEILSIFLFLPSYACNFLPNQGVPEHLRKPSNRIPTSSRVLISAHRETFRMRYISGT